MDLITSEARQIRKLMREAEGVTDETMIALARLKAAMVSARRLPNVHVSAGQKALITLNRAEQNIVAAYSDLLRVHSELSDLANVVGIFDEEIPTEFEKPKGELQLEPA